MSGEVWSAISGMDILTGGVPWGVLFGAVILVSGLALLAWVVSYARRYGSEHAYRRMADQRSEELSRQAERQAQALSTNSERRRAALAQLKRRLRRTGSTGTG